MKNLLILIFILTTTQIFANSVSVEIENDVIFGTDQRYTHGTKITYEYNKLNWSIGQNMYTPSDIDIATPITNDRPYSGFSYISLAGTKQWTDPTSKNGNRDIYQHLEVSLGVMGKYSGAENTQKLVHKWIDSSEPLGWKYQTDNRILAQIEGKIYGEMLSTKYLNSRVYMGSNIGTIFGNIGFGVNATVGYNIPHNLGNPIMSEKKDFSLFVFGDLYERHILWNETLESKYTDITINNNVLDIRTGIGITYKNIELKYSQCIRTLEFREQNDLSKFGTASVKINF